LRTVVNVLSAEIICPDFTFVVENEEEVVRAMGAYEQNAVKQRLRRGEGASGRLPVPKDGGQAMQRSKQLVESIDLIVKNYGRVWGASVEPNKQPRSEARDRAAAVRRNVARKRKALRADLAAAGVEEAAIKSQLKTIKSRRVHKTNMDVAAVLANDPKDKRARAGNRARYDLFATTEQEKKQLATIAANVARVALVEKQTGARHQGGGVAD
jgi:hypothetical protein